MKKRVIMALSLALSMVFLAACGGGNKAGTADKSQETKIAEAKEEGEYVQTVLKGKIFDAEDAEKIVEEYSVTKDIKGDVIEEKSKIDYTEFKQDYSAVYTYEYDDAGNKVKVTCKSVIDGQEDEIVIEYVNTYDDAGNLIKAEAPMAVYEYEDGFLVRATSDAGLKIITEYNKNGLIVLSEQYEDEELKYKEIYTYDENGVKTSLEYYSTLFGETPTERKTVYEIEYEYNDDGSIKQATSSDEESGYVDIYKFDANGNNICIEHYDERSLMYQLEEFEYTELSK